MWHYFIQFNHLLDRAGNLRGGYDRQPLEYYSTLLWAPGEVVVDGFAVPVDADAPPGEYYLDVGYYITVGESAVNLPLVVNGEMTDTTSVTVGPIYVVAPWQVSNLTQGVFFLYRRIGENYVWFFLKNIAGVTT